MRTSSTLDLAKSSPSRPLANAIYCPGLLRCSVQTQLACLAPCQSRTTSRCPAGVQQQKEGIIDRQAGLGRSLLLLVESLSDGVPLDLLVDHEGESLEIGARLPPRLGRDLLGPSGSLPLGGNLSGLEVLLDRRGTGGSGKRLEDEGGEGELLVRNGLSGNRGGRSVDESLRCNR